jgi:hypothetical protein
MTKLLAVKLKNPTNQISRKAFINFNFREIETCFCSLRVD